MLKKVLFLGKRADYYKTIVDALHARGLHVAIATTPDGAVAMCLTDRVLLVIIDCDEEWPSDCWHPARSIKAVAPLVPVAAGAGRLGDLPHAASARTDAAASAETKW